MDKDLASRTKVVMDGGTVTVPINKNIYSIQASAQTSLRTVK
jgi:hypothetical protein